MSAPGGRPPEPRQRWRIVFAPATPRLPPEHGDGVAGWEAALIAAGLPLAYSQGRRGPPAGGPRSRVAGRRAGEAELADVLLTDRLTRVEFRSRLAERMPSGHDLVDLFDVWLGEPSLAARLAAADYRLDVGGASPVELADACSCAARVRHARSGHARRARAARWPTTCGRWSWVWRSAPEPGHPTARRCRPWSGCACATARKAARVARTRSSSPWASTSARDLVVGRAIRERLLTSDELPPG